MDCARSIGEGSSMDIVITRSGETKYTFRDSQESCACAALRHCKEKSWGITSTSGALMGHQMVENVADAVLPVGSERQRVCMKCFTVSKSIKIREDCPSISFCSNKCLEASSLLLDDCGLLITSIRDWSRSEQFAESGQYADLAVLAVIVLYNSSLTKNIRGLHNVSLLLRLETHPAKEFPEISRVSTLLLALLERLSPALLTKSFNTVGHLEKLIRALQFNAQPLPIPGLPPGTALLTVLPQTLARVNHSCSPNAVLTYGVRQAATSSSSSSSLKSRSSTILNGDSEGGLMKSENDRQIVVWLTSLRQIFPGEEICVSYLYQLCSPHIARREMLQGAFHFNCRCVRCVRESVDVPHSNKWEEGKIDMIGIKERTAIQPIEVDSSLSSLSTSLSTSKVTSEDPDDGLQTFLTSILEKAARRKSQGTGQSDSGDHKSGSASGSGREEDILTSTEMLAVLNFCSEQSSHNNTSSKTAYLLHDSGMLVLKTALVNRKNLLVKASQSSSSSLSGGQKASGSHPVSQSAGLEEIDEIILRASVLVAGCWKTLDCESPARLDLLLTGIAAGLRIRQTRTVGVPSPLKRMAEEAIHLLSLYHPIHTYPDPLHREDCNSSGRMSGSTWGSGGTSSSPSTIFTYTSLNSDFILQAHKLCQSALT